MEFEKYASYKFHNELNIRFITDNPDFYNFVEENLSFFKKDKEDAPPDLEVRVYFYKKDDSNLKTKIAKNLFCEENQVLYYDRSGFKIYAKENMPFQIVVYVWKKPFRDILNFILSGPTGAKEEKYLTIMRGSIYLPIFYLLEKKGYIILHGSAVSKNNKAYLFLGANRVGKTTIAFNLISRYNFKLLSDDFLVIKDDKIYAFPDKVRATPFTLSSLPIQTKSRLIYSKYHILLSSDKIDSFSSPTKIFFVQAGPELKIEKIDLTIALKRLNATHNFIREFPEYSYLAFLPAAPLINDIQTRYADFLQNKNLFLFQSGEEVNRNITLLLKNLD